MKRGKQSKQKKDSRVVRHVDNRLVGTTHKLSLVLDPQQHNLFPLLILLLADSINHTGLYLAGEPFIPVRTDDPELDALPALDALEPAGDLSHPHGLGAFPDLLAPTNDSAVEIVDAVVGGEGVRFAAVERVQTRVGDAVGYAADGLAEEGIVVGLVEGLRGESLDDVYARDVEFLDNRTEGEEGYGGVGRHYFWFGSRCSPFLLVIRLVDQLGWVGLSWWW